MGSQKIEVTRFKVFTTGNLMKKGKTSNECLPRNFGDEHSITPSNQIVMVTRLYLSEESFVKKMYMSQIDSHEKKNRFNVYSGLKQMFWNIFMYA